MDERRGGLLQQGQLSNSFRCVGTRKFRVEDEPAALMLGASLLSARETDVNYPDTRRGNQVTIMKIFLTLFDYV